MTSVCILGPAAAGFLHVAKPSPALILRLAPLAVLGVFNTVTGLTGLRYMKLPVLRSQRRSRLLAVNGACLLPDLPPASEAPGGKHGATFASACDGGRLAAYDVETAADVPAVAAHGSADAGDRREGLQR